jgi:hypothetical protein
MNANPPFPGSGLSTRHESLGRFNRSEDRDRRHLCLHTQLLLARRLVCRPYPADSSGQSNDEVVLALRLGAPCAGPITGARPCR